VGEAVLVLCCGDWVQQKVEKGPGGNMRWLAG
jgi:hypothetical protein